VEAPFLRAAIFFLILVAAVVVRVSNYEEVFKPFSGHLNFLDPDSYYQLRRLAHFVTHFPEVMRFDVLLDWPNGSKVDWLPGLPWLLGIPLKLFGVSGYDSLETSISFLMIALGVLHILLVYFLIRRVIPDRRFWLFGLFLGAVLPSMVRYSCLGQVDHHIFESILPLGGLYFILRWFDRPKNIFWGIALAGVLALGVWTSAILLFLALWVPVFVAFAAPLNFGGRNFLVPFALCLSLCGLAVWDVGQTPLFSAFQTYLLILASFGGAGLIWLGRTSPRKLIFKGLGISFVLLFISAFFIPQIQIGNMILVAKAYLFPSSDVLTSVLEAQPLFGKWSVADFQFVHGNYGYLFIPVTLFCLGSSFIKTMPRLMRMTMLYAIPFFILALIQKRLGTFLAPFVVIGISIFAWQVSKILADKGIELAGAISTLILALSFSPAFQNGFALSIVNMHAVDLPIEKLFVERLNIDKEEAWNRLVGKSAVDYGIVAHPNLGHALTYISGIPTTDNSFFHPETLRKDLERRDIKETKDLVKNLRDQKIRYVLVADDLLYHQFLWRLFRKDKEFPLKTFENQNGHLVHSWDLDAMDETAWYRLLTQSNLPKDFKFVFGLSVKNSGHFYENVKLVELNAH